MYTCIYEGSSKIIGFALKRGHVAPLFQLVWKINPYVCMYLGYHRLKIYGLGRSEEIVVEKRRVKNRVVYTTFQVTHPKFYGVPF